MGYAKTFKCSKCDTEFDYTTDGRVFRGKFKVFHYQCPECKNIDEEWINNNDGKAKSPSGVVCSKCGKKTKAVSLKTIVCPCCGSNEFTETPGVMLD